MSDAGAQVIEAFLGSTLVFSRAVNALVDERVLEQAGGDRLTPSQVTVLRLVEQSARTVGELADLLRVSNAAASKTIDRMVRRGLIARREGVNDRRSTEVDLAEAGRRLLAEYESARSDMLARTFGQVPQQQLRRAARLLDRLSNTLMNHSPDPEGTCLQCYIYGAERCPVRGSSAGCQNRSRRSRGGRQ